MSIQKTYRIDVHAKGAIRFNIALICLICLAGTAVAILYWKELDIFYRSALLGSSVLSVLFLAMYVINVEWNEEGLLFGLPHKTVKRALSDISSVRVMKRFSNDYLEIRIARPIGIRKRFYFLIADNAEEIAEMLNELLMNDVRVYANNSLDTKVIFNREHKRFEAL